SPLRLYLFSIRADRVLHVFPHAFTSFILLLRNTQFQIPATATTFSMKKNTMLLSVCALVICTSCHSRNEAPKENTRFLVTAPLVTDTTVIKQYVCQIRSIRHIEVRSQEKGYLEKIYVDEGQFVRKGQLLFQIMPKV